MGHSFFVRQVQFYKTETLMTFKSRKPGLLKVYIIVFVEVVKPPYIISALKNQKKKRNSTY